MSIRAQQIGSEIRDAVQMILARGELHDPRIRGLITITGVAVTEDLAEARISVSVLPAEHGDLTMHGLRSAASLLRRQIGRRVRMRSIPRLTFQLDESLKKQAAVVSAIRDAIGPGSDDMAIPGGQRQDGSRGGDSS